MKGLECLIKSIYEMPGHQFVRLKVQILQSNKNLNQTKLLKFKKKNSNLKSRNKTPNSNNKENRIF